MSIVQGDNGILFSFSVDKKKVDDLTGSTVEVAIKRGIEILTKSATIIDSTTGKCECTLLSSDLTVSGPYQYQWTVTFEDGRSLSGNPSDFYVSEKLVGVPPSNGGDIVVTVDGGDLG